MLKNIFQTAVGTSALRNGFATFLKNSSWSGGGPIRFAGTSTFHHRRDGKNRPQIQTFSVPLATEKASTGYPQSEQLSADTLSLSLSRLCLTPEEAAATLEYRLPSVLSDMQNVILDPLASVTIPAELPTAVSRDFLDVPSAQYDYNNAVIGDQEKDSSTGKWASNIIQKRHRKMKRHQYKKWRQRNRFKLRIRKQKRRKKQRERWERHLSRFRFTELSAAEGEKHLQKKRERLHIFLRYLGVPVDDIIKEKEVQVDDVSKKKNKRHTRIISSQGSGQIIPQPILPDGVLRKCTH